MHLKMRSEEEEQKAEFNHRLLHKQNERRKKRILQIAKAIDRLSELTVTRSRWRSSSFATFSRCWCSDVVCRTYAILSFSSLCSAWIALRCYMQNSSELVCMCSFFYVRFPFTLRRRRRCRWCISDNTRCVDTQSDEEKHSVVVGESFANFRIADVE